MLKRSLIVICIILVIGLISILILNIHPKTINILGNEYSINTKILDLSNTQIDNDMNWATKLNEFNNLKTVKLGNKKIYKGDIEKLKLIYPNINFEGNFIIKMYGLEIPENETKINFNDIELDNNIINYLKQFKNLKEVDFGNTKIDTNLQFKLIEKYPDITFQWLVNINNKYYSNNSEEIDLSNTNINDYDEFTKILKLFPTLKKLDMSNTNLTNEQLGSLREQFPNIEINWIVHFGRWKMRTDRVAFSVLIVDFSHKRLTTEDIQVLKYCTKLQALDLGHQAIEDISVIGDYLQELRLLILADNKIKDITPLAKLKKLHYLELFMNNIEDLTPLENLDGLVDLNLSYNYRLSNIQPILKLPKLERLWIVSTRISYQDVNLLKSTYPNTKISTTGKGSTDNGWRSHKRYFTYIDMFNKDYISDLFLQYD